VGVKAAGALDWQPYHLHVPIVLKSGSLNLLEPLGPVNACYGIALPFNIDGTGCFETLNWYIMMWYETQVAGNLSFFFR
jgi:hypothetical protein